MNAGTKTMLRTAGLGKYVDKIEAGFCPTCGKPVAKEDFRDALSVKEFEINGMCQDCQDEVRTF